MQSVQLRQRFVRLKWAAPSTPSQPACDTRTHDRLVLDSFELIRSAAPLDSQPCEASPQAYAAAASLLVSLLTLPANSVVTADIPLVPPHSNALQTLSDSRMNTLLSCSSGSSA